MFPSPFIFFVSLFLTEKKCLSVSAETQTQFIFFVPVLIRKEASVKF